MKRSEINGYIKRAMSFFAENKFFLPPFAFFAPGDWQGKTEQCHEVFDLKLGWDVTSFGTGDFNNTGLLLFTLRNGAVNSSQYPKAYAEKIMMTLENQVTPKHFHWHKSEDIINRGGGNLIMEVWQADRNDNVTDAEFSLSIDGMERLFKPGEKLILAPGESVCMEPYIAHRFYGEPGSGPVMVGEVSMVNDDANDNCFIDDLIRFDPIEEDADPVVLLVSDYI